MKFFKKRNCFVFCILFLLIFISYCSLASTKNSEKIGVLYSYQNVESYKKNDIVGFYQVWKSFLETFEETYLNPQFLCNLSQDTKVEDIGVNVIFFPLAIDIDQDETIFLNNFLSSGGKLIISSGIGPISDSLKNFLSQHGVVIKKNVIAENNLNLRHKNDEVVFGLPVGNFYSIFDLSGDARKTAARWKENNQIAIGGTKNLIYLGYSWGQDIDKNKDTKTLLKTIDYFWSDISSRLTREITKEEYEKTVKEILSLKEEGSSVIELAEQLDLAVPRFELKNHFDSGVRFFNDFNSYYLFGNYLEARERKELAKNEFSLVYSIGIPVRDIEIRAIWLDRGTIVDAGNPSELRNLIKNLVRLGFNVIFFETVNAGYPIYPSMLLVQNPLINNWDPLQVAIEAAHTYGAELHAWVWTFASGNTKHNLLIDKPVQYPGPIIATKGRSWALTSQDGRLRIEAQPETWISPGNEKACGFLIELFSEIVKNYDVDGIQFDYIRFPFQKKYSQVGFDFVTKNAFINATGEIPKIEGKENKIWRQWKVGLINNFVRDASLKLKKIKPNLKVSAAVFAIDRPLRIHLIQQDWETWIQNKWVDAVYPFYYSFAKDEVETKLASERELTGDQAIIVPGFNLRVLSLGELAEMITAARNSGSLGVSLFAAEHLSSEKKELLKKGPFRERTIFIPYNKPYIACQKLLDEFILIIEKFAVSKKLSALSDKETQKEVYRLAKDLKSEFKDFKLEKASDIEKKLINLQSKVKEWLSLEKYLNREQRALYISNYLDQVRTLLNYMKKDSTNIPSD